MKKIIILVALILLPSKYLFGQAKLLLNEVVIKTPCHITHYAYSDCPNESSDNNWNKYYDIGVNYGYNYFFDSYKRVGDLVQFFSNGASTISFVFDSIHNRINNLTVNNGGGGGGGQEYFFFQIDSCGFTVNKDTIIVEWLNPKLSKFYYYYESSNGCITVTRGHYGFHQNATTVDSTFSGVFKLLISQENAVSSNTSSPTRISVFNDILHQDIHFSFLLLTHSEPLLIYDILGREVKRIEIPSGVSEYSIPREQFRSGSYFARLGNMTASFVVD